MPLKVVKRKSTGAWTITGTVAGIRIQRRASTNNRRLAQEEASALEARLLREQFHGPKRGTKTFREAALSYADAVPRADSTYKRLARLVAALGANTPLNAIDQDAAIGARDRVLKPGASPATVLRDIITPLRAVLNYAAKRGWCDPPAFEAPTQPEGRTLYLTPAETERLIGQAAQHLKPLLTFLVGTGARVSEALELEQRDVDLTGGRAILWKTKGGKRRNVMLPPRVVEALTSLRRKEVSDFVFLTPAGEHYPSHRGQGGGQLKTAWRGAIRRSGLNPAFTPHTLRHTWASWHYALNKDPLKLMVDGGWTTLRQVERYAHLLPSGHEEAVERFLGLHVTAVQPLAPPKPSIDHLSN